jgi:hypothetical protein
MKRCNICKLEKPLTEFYSGMRFRAKLGREVHYVTPECKPCYMVRTKAYYQANKASLRPKENAYNREKRALVKDAVFVAYGGYVCACCGETEKAFLTLDHIDNDGAANRRKIAGKRHAAGYWTYDWIVKNDYPVGFQILCMNCNFGKRMNKGVCPHQDRCNDYSQEVGASAPKRSTSNLHGWNEDIVSPIVKAVAAN